MSCSVSAPDDDLVPLYEGARLTTKSSQVLIRKFLLRHYLSDSAKGDLFKLIELHCPRGNKCCTSKYLFEKECANLQTKITMHTYCSKCSQDLELVEDDHCPNCHQCVNKKEFKSYFLEMSIVDQLRTLFKSKCSISVFDFQILSI